LERPLGPSCLFWFFFFCAWESKLGCSATFLSLQLFTFDSFKIERLASVIFASKDCPAYDFFLAFSFLERLQLAPFVLSGSPPPWKSLVSRVLIRSFLPLAGNYDECKPPRLAFPPSPPHLPAFFPGLASPRGPLFLIPFCHPIPLFRSSPPWKFLYVKFPYCLLLLCHLDL